MLSPEKINCSNFACRNAWHEFFSYATLALLLCSVFFSVTPLTELNAGLEADGRHYAAIAEHGPGGSQLARIAPWCHRLLTPLLAGLLPLETLASFQLLAFVSSLVNLILCSIVLRRAGLAHAQALLAQLLYAGVFWSLKFSFYAPAYIDYQSQTFGWLLLWCLLARRFHLTTLVLAITSLQKESAFFWVLVGYVARRAEPDAQAAHGRVAKLYALQLLAAAGSGYLLTHALVQQLNQYAPEAVLRTIIMTQLGSAESILRVLQEILLGAGMLLALLLSDPSGLRRELGRQPIWLALIAVGMLQLFSGWDKGRLLLPMLPAVLFLSAHALPVSALSSVAGMAYVTITLLLHWLIGHHFEPLGSHAAYLQRMVPVHSSEPYLPIYLLIAACYACWLLALLLFRRSLQLPAKH
jgi:hypothetical protein